MIMANGALEGVKIVDFGWGVVVPLLTKNLADHGAQVIRIESATRVESLRTTRPYKDNKPGVDRATFYAVYNNNKFGCTLNLNHPRAEEIVKKIVNWADIVAAGYTPGAMERLGFGYEDLKRMKSDIIVIFSSNFELTRESPLTCILFVLGNVNFYFCLSVHFV